MSTPHVKFKFKIKKHPKFKRPNRQNKKRLMTSWRHPRGIDNKIRRKIKGYGDSPRIGYKKQKELRNLLPNGFKKIVIRNVKELEALISLNKVYCAEIAACIGARKRIEIINRAKELDIEVTNKEARVMIAED